MSDPSQIFWMKIFDNPLFLIDNKMINVKGNNWTEAGILKVSNVWNDTTNTFISKSDWKKITKLQFLTLPITRLSALWHFKLRNF